MSEDIVFKFVTLRAPAGAEEGGLLAISPEEGDDEGFIAVLEPIRADTPRDRLGLAAEKIVGGPLYLLNDPDWRARFGDDLDALTGEIDAGAFRSRAEVLLKSAVPKEAERPQGWETPALRRKIWTGYIASLFARGDRGRETRFFLNLIRIAFAHRRSAGDLAALNLSKRRAALPVSLFAAGLVQALPPLTRGPGATATADPAAAEVRRVSGLISALHHALKALDAAKARKRARLIEQTFKAVPAPPSSPPRVAGAASRNAPPPVAVKPVKRTAPPLAYSLQHITYDELGDAKAAKTMADHGMDPSAGAAVVRGKLLELIGARTAELGRLRTREVISWEKGGFVRLRRPVFVEGGLK